MKKLDSVAYSSSRQKYRKAYFAIEEQACYELRKLFHYDRATFVYLGGTSGVFLRNVFLLDQTPDGVYNGGVRDQHTIYQIRRTKEESAAFLFATHRIEDILFMLLIENWVAIAGIRKKYNREMMSLGNAFKMYSTSTKTIRSAKDALLCKHFGIPKMRFVNIDLDCAVAYSNVVIIGRDIVRKVFRCFWIDDAGIGWPILVPFPNTAEHAEWITIIGGMGTKEQGHICKLLKIIQGWTRVRSIRAKYFE